MIAFNVVSLTDEGTGDTYTTFTNNMNNDDYAFGTAVAATGDGVRVIQHDSSESENVYST